MSKIVVLTVTYGNRWKFLSRVVNAVINDPYLYQLVIFNNNSENFNEIEEFVNIHKDKIHLINSEKNIGSAGGFAAGLEYIRNLSCDYVLLLDDDNVPEKNFSEKFLNNIKTLSDEKAVILGNRNSFKNNENSFYKTEKVSEKIPTTFFDVFSVKKLCYFSKLFFLRNNKNNPNDFKPIVQVESFAYGGAFLPIQAVKDSVLPDPKLFTYGDDIEYSWNVRQAGYKIYACTEPIIKDVDFTFQESHIFGLFSKSTLDFKVFFRMRNSVIISLRHSKNKIIVITNVFIWSFLLYLVCLFKFGPSRFFIKRMLLIARSIKAGIRGDFEIPKYIVLPSNTKK